MTPDQSVTTTGRFSSRLVLSLFMMLMVGALFAPFALGQSDSYSEAFQQPMQIAADWVISIFSLDFIGGDEDRLVALTRFFIWLVTFVIIYEVLTKVLQNFSNQASKVIAIAIASVSAIFMPNAILIFIGETYAAALALVMIGVIVFAAWRIGDRMRIENGGERFVFIALNAAMLWMITLVNSLLISEGNLGINNSGPSPWSIVGMVFPLAIIAIVINVIRKWGGYATSGMGGGGGGLFGGGSKLFDRKDLGKAIEDDREAAKETKEAMEATAAAQQLSKVDDQIKAAEINIGNNILKALKQVGEALGALEGVAKSAEDGSPQAAQQAQQAIVPIQQGVGKILSLMQEDTQLAQRREKNARIEGEAIKKVKQKLKYAVRQKLGDHSNRMKRAFNSTKDSKGVYQQLQGRQALYQKYDTVVKQLRKRADKLLSEIESIEKKATSTTQDGEQTMKKQMKKLQEVFEDLRKISRSPDHKSVSTLRNKVKKIRKKIKQSVLGTASGKSVSNIEQEMVGILAEIKKVEDLFARMDADTASMMEKQLASAPSSDKHGKVRN